MEHQPKPERPESQPRQWFQFGGWIFNVDRAEAILADKPREPEPLPVLPWVRLYGLDLLDQPGSAPIIGLGPHFDRDYAMTTDLTRPLLVATLHLPGSGNSLLLIDGTHRLYRAYREGVAELSAHVLDVTETLAIRQSAYQRRD